MSTMHIAPPPGGVKFCHLFMILLQVLQLLSQALDLHLQVRLGKGQFVQYPA